MSSPGESGLVVVRDRGDDLETPFLSECLPDRCEHTRPRHSPPELRMKPDNHLNHDRSPSHELHVPDDVSLECRRDRPRVRVEHMLDKVHRLWLWYKCVVGGPVYVGPSHEVLHHDWIEPIRHVELAGRFTTHFRLLR